MQKIIIPKMKSKKPHKNNKIKIQKKTFMSFKKKIKKSKNYSKKTFLNFKL